MIERMDPALPISQQCRLLAVPRSSVYRKSTETSAEDLAIMVLIDRQYLARPYYGSRRMAAWLATQGHVINRKRGGSTRSGAPTLPTSRWPGVLSTYMSA
jgi:putative transposase